MTGIKSIATGQEAKQQGNIITKVLLCHPMNDTPSSALDNAMLFSEGVKRAIRVNHNVLI